MRTITAAVLAGLWLAVPTAAFELSGRLTLAGAGSEPAAGATVEAVPFESADERARREALGEAAPPAIAEATAGDDGRFALVLPDAAGPLQLQVRISGEGLVPVAVARVVAGPDDADLGEIVLPEAEALSGRVVGPAGGPVVGAEVVVSAELRGWTGVDNPLLPLPQWATTDGEGRFRVESAAKRGNRLEIRALGLAPVTHEPVAAGELAAPLALVPGRVLAGRILEPDRERAASGALVRFEAKGSVTAWHPAGPDGRFRLEDAAEGPGVVRVEAGERGRAEQRLDGDPPDEPLEVVLDAPAGFRGRVIEAETGRGVAGASVLLSSLGRVWATVADRDGRWAQAGLPPGAWEVRIEAPGRVPWRREEVRLGPAGDEVLDAVLERAVALRGRVVDEEGEPVAGARCRLERTGETGWEAFMSRVRSRGAVRSDAEGRFELRGLPAGTGQSLLVEHDDYAAARLGGIDLVPGQPPGTITVVLSPGLGLSGRVVDVDGAPVEGADVMLHRTRQVSFGGVISYSSGDRRSAKSDAEGSFAFHGLEVAGYEVRARHDDYAAADLGVVEVSDETQGEPLEIVLQPGAAIRGVVRTPDGQPAAGYRVMAEPEGGRGRGSFQLPEPTGLDGAFAIEGLQVGGRYDVQLLGDGSEVDRRDGVVAPAEGLELRAPGDGRIEVVARDERGAPLTEFEVSYQPTGQRMFGFPNPRPGYGQNRIPVRSGDGRYVMDVPAGTWQVEVRARGYQTGRSGEVVVEAGRTTPGVTVRLEEGHAIRGRVLAARDRRPIADARVLAESAGFMYFGPDNPNERRSDADGAFEIDGLATGPYTVVARHPDWSETSQSVELESGGREVELLMGEGSRITGTVVSANTPVGGAEVSLAVAGDPRTAMRTNRAAVSDAGGRFAFEHLSPGRYTVSARLRGRTGQGVEVVVAADATVADVVVPLDGGTHIAGVVEGLEPDRLRQVSVVASGPGGFRVQVRPGADGRFDVTGAPSGTLRVGAMLGSWEGMRQISEELVIAEGQTEATVVLRFETGFRLEGRVTRAGAPVDGASLSLSREDGGGYASGRTDADGRYAIEDLREGQWVLRVRVGNRQSAGATREVEITGDALLDVELDTARIAGRVVGADTGRPLSGASVSVVDPAEDRWLGGTQTDSDGRFAVEDLEPGPYQAHVRKAAYQQKVLDVTASSTSDVLVELEPGEGITLVARDGIHGTPMRSLQVRVLDASGATYYAGSVLLDSEGRGELQALPPGSYRLRAAAEGYATTAELPLAVPSAELSLVLTPGGALEVRAGAETRARPDPGFRLLRADGSAYAPQLHRTEPQVPLTGPVTRLAHVLAGDYRLVVAGGGSHEVRVREGAVAVVELP